MKRVAMRIKHFNIIGIIILMCCMTKLASADVVAIGDVDPTDPTTWTLSTDGYIGYTSDGSLDISDGATVSDNSGYIGHWAGSNGTVTVDGTGSAWTNSDKLYVGLYGDGTLGITGGGTVSDAYGCIGYNFTSTSEVTVDGAGSTWANSGSLYIGYFGIGTLDITGGGMVSVNGTLAIDNYGLGNSYVNMASGGMLAVMGEADGSLVEFLGLVDGSDAIRYWDSSILNWADITGATSGLDYTLDYITDGGDLDGYTILTVSTVPEPCTLALLAFGGFVLRRRRMWNN